jgi:hypothetical protein
LFAERSSSGTPRSATLAASTLSARNLRSAALIVPVPAATGSARIETIPTVTSSRKRPIAFASSSSASVRSPSPTYGSRSSV